jgi:hypothetical protein
VSGPGILCRELGGTLILHESSSGQVFNLNPSASLIFCLCDGQHDESAIFQELQKAFPMEDPLRLSEDLRQTLDHLRRVNVIIADQDA